MYRSHFGSSLQHNQHHRCLSHCERTAKEQSSLALEPDSLLSGCTARDTQGASLALEPRNVVSGLYIRLA